MPNIPANARWLQNGETVAAGNGRGNATNQLYYPYGLFVADNQTVIIADNGNHRIVEWKIGDTKRQVIAGGHDEGNRLDQLKRPTDELIDKETDTSNIRDSGNQRVTRWSRAIGTTHGEIILDNIDCFGLAIDDERFLYISDAEKDEVRRYKMGDTNGTLVAGGHGKGDGLNQLNFPTYIFIASQQSVYVSDEHNHRVMKWNNGATEGIIVAGGQGQGQSPTQLSYPEGLFADTLDAIYVADYGNHRVMRWLKGATQGTVIVGGNGQGLAPNQ
ncbi:unnamed protein product, partial [Rotaria sp. Silwood1]